MSDAAEHPPGGAHEHAPHFPAPANPVIAREELIRRLGAAQAERDLSRAHHRHLLWIVAMLLVIIALFAGAIFFGVQRAAFLIVPLRSENRDGIQKTFLRTSAVNCGVGVTHTRPASLGVATPGIAPANNFPAEVMGRESPVSLRRARDVSGASGGAGFFIHPMNESAALSAHPRSKMAVSFDRDTA